MKRTIFLLTLTLLVAFCYAADPDYQKSKEYLSLRDSVHHAFNAGDSARFFPALKKLQDYLLKQNDLHAYYTQRCNEIVFQLNRQKIYEAYVLGRDLSMELREKKLDKEMYMAYNMLGHLNRYCGNKAAAKRNFHYVIEQMEKYGYYESMPPIYMNLVNVELSDDPEEAQRLLEKAKEIAEKYSPERVFDIETRKSLSYFNAGNIDKFLEGYQEYRKGVAEGKSSVHGRNMEIYYLACIGKTDEAIELAKKNLGEENGEVITKVYEMAGRWKEAYESLRKETAINDSANNVVLINSMAGVREQLTLYDVQRKTTRNRTIAFTISIILLALLVTALSYIVNSRRRHLRELKIAYEHALESDRMKTAFIQNVSHEVRTPLNIISGFSQIIASPGMTDSQQERQRMAHMIQKNCHRITELVDEVLEMSLTETSDSEIDKNDMVNINGLLRDLIQENMGLATEQTKILFDTTLSEEFNFKTNKTILKRIINVLLDNAIKNTEKGKITIKATAVGINLILAVEDTGTGIPAVHAEQIFERFYKVDTFKEGLGLGLPLCRKLVERLDGTVLLDTTYKGPGARFVVTLPLGSEESFNFQK
jgi:signal transduction histidine kinase